MCGIVGFLHPPGTGSCEPGILTGVAASISHRGPGGVDLWLSDDRRVGLARQRQAPAQPAAGETGRIQATLDGLITNQATLRGQLEQVGHRRAPTFSDIDILIHGYREWGIEGLLDRMDGVFAFGLWDGEREILHLVRDRIGVRPLYFAWIDGALAFASEIKALLAHPRMIRDICAPAFWHALSFLTPPAPLTLFEGIFKLPAGHRLETRADGSVGAGQWWHPAPGRGEDLTGLSGAARDFLVAGLRTHLERAVASQVPADATLGVFLSGGMEPVALAALAHRLTGQQVDTFAVAFSDHGPRTVPDLADPAVRHHAVTIGRAEAESYLDQLIHDQDEPIADWSCIPRHFQSELAKANGAAVVMSDDGADELFCGHPSWRKWLRLHTKTWTPLRRWVPRPVLGLAAELAAPLAWARPDLTPRLDIAARAARPDGELFWGSAVAMWDSRKNGLVPDAAAFTGSAAAEMLVPSGLLPASWLTPDSAAVPGEILARFDARHPECDQLARMTYLDLKLRLPELLLMRSDKIGHASMVETRQPFLDHHLVDFALNIGRADTMAGGARSLLKQAVRGLVPDPILDRPRSSPGTPMAQWLKGEFGLRVKSEIMASSLLDRFGFSRGAVTAMIDAHRADKGDSALPIWTLWNICAWNRRWIGETKHLRGGCCG
jgi:asparagine synthase (glutamine-hydrolysing)